MSEKTEFFTVGECVLAFPSLFQPSAPRGSNADPKYNTTLLVTQAQYDSIKPQIDALLAKAFPGVDPVTARLGLPFQPCSNKADRYPEAAQQGMWFANAKSQFEVQVVDAQRQPIVDPGVVKDGARAYVSVNLYSYNTAGNQGIGVGLGPVMFVKEGEPMNVSSAVNVNDAFAGVQVDAAAAPAPAAAPPPPPPGS